MNKSPQQIIDVAYSYLQERLRGQQEKLDYYLNLYKYQKPTNMAELFHVMLDHAQNRQGMLNSIGDTEELRPFLFGFNHTRVLEEYTGWEQLFDKIQDNYQPPGRMEKQNNHNFWVLFCKSILSIARYLSRFDSFENFNKYVDQFIREDNPDLRIALPLILSEEVFGYRFALACDFLKENISPKFVKPDTHIKDIFIKVGACDPEDSDYDVFRKVILFAQETDQEPYWVDKLFWLIGSQYFYKTKNYPAIQKIKVSKSEFLERL